VKIKTNNIKSLKYTLLVFIFYINICRIFAQNTSVPIKISSEIVVIDGKSYYIHYVNQGETLYSICKTYDVSEKEISKANPSLVLGLKAGEAIKIPVNKKALNNKNNSDYIYYEVQKGNTLFSISKKFDIEIETIYKYNPEAQYGIKVGQLLKIPRGKENIENADTEDDEYIYHTVKRKETLFSLSKYYNKDINQIIEANQELIAEGLKAGQVIRIPKKQIITKTIIDRQNIHIAESLYYSHDSIIGIEQKTVICNQFQTPVSKNINIVLLLPFYLQENLLFLSDSSNNKSQLFNKSTRFIEFYEGVLIALDTLKKQGISVNMYTYSVEKDTIELKKILQKLENKDINLIIGPVFSNGIKIVSEFARRKNIYAILPFTNQRNALLNNPYIILPKTTVENEIENYAKYLAAFPFTNIVLISQKNYLDSIKISKLKQRLLLEINKNSNLDHYRIKEIIYNDSIERSLSQAFIIGQRNIVYINSKEEPLISELLTRLNGKKLYYSISVIGDPDWLMFQSVDEDYFFSLNFSYLSSAYIDYESLEVLNFLRKFRNYYYTEPPFGSDAFYGYDLTFYFLKGFSIFGKDFPFCINEMHLGLLQSDFQFVRFNANSGFENVRQNIYEYNPQYIIKKTLLK
jgi:LysM repeat protein